MATCSRPADALTLRSSADGQPGQQQLECDRIAVNQLYHRILIDSRAIYLKYSRSASFDPYTMSPSTLHAFFDEIMQNAAWIG